MKFALIGAGAMGKAILEDILRSPEVSSVLVGDTDGRRASQCVAAFRDRRLRAVVTDAYDVDGTAETIGGQDVVINAAQYDVNLNVMQACLRARCHYLDLGGLFHTTRRQLELAGDFERAGLTAILGMGAAPGITNVLARYACDRLDEVASVALSFAAADLTERKVDVFAPPYSIRTIMEEFSEDTVQFLDGGYRTLPALSGAIDIDFPEPIGRRSCYHTLHSEPATIPESFRDKGIREVTWRLSLPPEFEEKAKLLAAIGFAEREPVEIGSVKVAPIDALAAVVERRVMTKLAGVDLEPKEVGCARCEAVGKKDGREATHVVECLVRSEGKGSSLVGKATGVPPSIVAGMLAAGAISRPGVWGPEQVVEPDLFFLELTRRGVEIRVTTRTRPYG